MRLSDIDSVVEGEDVVVCVELVSSASVLGCQLKVDIDTADFIKTGQSQTHSVRMQTS